MKCVVPSQNVKVLAKALHSLGRIGEDLFIEPHVDQIAFRTVNMAESAYAYFIFTKLFFSSFTFTEEDSQESLRCKIAMKSLLAIFKFPHGERLIEWCQIKLDSNGTKVIFQLKYSYGCTKTHFLPVIDSETLQANYSKDDCQNRLSTTSKLLSTAVKNFRANEDEVTLCVMSRKLIMRNHLENNLDSKKSVKTEISLFADEFESYNIQTETSITFCLKELKAVLFFAEFTGLPVEFYIGEAGKPVVFVVQHELLYEANYVVSTLNEAGTAQQLSQTSESSTTTSNQPFNPSNRPLHNTRKRPYEKTNEASRHIEHHNTSQSTHIDRPPRPSTSNVSQTEDIYRNNTLVSGEAGLNNSVISGAPSQFPELTNVTTDTNVTQPMVKAVFPRCFDATFRKKSLPGYDKVLVYDSDGMEDSD